MAAGAVKGVAVRGVLILLAGLSVSFVAGVLLFTKVIMPGTKAGHRAGVWIVKKTGAVSEVLGR